jgi:hypothetical protein
MHKMSARVGIEKWGRAKVLPEMPQSVLEQAEGTGEESMTDEQHNENWSAIVLILLVVGLCGILALVGQSIKYQEGYRAGFVEGMKENQPAMKLIGFKEGLKYGTWTVDSDHPLRTTPSIGICDTATKNQHCKTLTDNFVEIHDYDFSGLKSYVTVYNRSVL